MRPKLNSLALSRLVSFGGREMLNTVPRTTSPPSSTEVETLCVGAVSSLGAQDDFTALRGRWMGPCTVKSWMRTSFPQPGRWSWFYDGSSSVTMTQNIQPRQQRSGSRRGILRFSQCPDLNSIEKLRRERRLRFSKRQLPNLQDLKRISKRVKRGPNLFTNYKKRLTSVLSPPNTESRFACTYFTRSNTNEFSTFI